MVIQSMVVWRRLIYVYKYCLLQGAQLSNLAQISHRRLIPLKHSFHAEQTFLRKDKNQDYISQQVFTEEIKNVVRFSTFLNSRDAHK